MTENIVIISWRKRDKVWQAKIRVNGVDIHLGNFKNKDDAARAYNTTVIKHFGEFAVLNIIH